MSQEIPFSNALKLFVAIIDKDGFSRMEDVLLDKHVHFHYAFNAVGTASSEILKAFGLSGTEKTVCLCIEPVARLKVLMTSVIERMELTRPGKGIAFTIPMSGVSASVTNVFSGELEPQKERASELMDREEDKVGSESRYEMVISVINQGYSEILMDAAKEAGARGGTIIHARRSGLEDAVKFFGVSLQAEKEIVAILIHKSQKKELMQAISKSCGIRTEARGIILSLPVESCAGIAIPEEE